MRRRASGHHERGRTSTRRCLSGRRCCRRRAAARRRRPCRRRRPTAGLSWRRRSACSGSVATLRMVRSITASSTLRHRTTMIHHHHRRSCVVALRAVDVRSALSSPAFWVGVGRVRSLALSPPWPGAVPRCRAGVRPRAAPGRRRKGQAARCAATPVRAVQARSRRPARGAGAASTARTQRGA